MWRRLRNLVWVALAALVMRACVLEPVRMTDASMTPTLADGDVLFISKLSYGLRVPGSGSLLVEWGKPQKGDLVLATGVGDPPATLVRRVEAISGEKVILPDGKEALLKAGEYFLRSDKEEGTMDSRKFGPVTSRAIAGKLSYVWAAKTASNAGPLRVDSSQPKTE